MQIENYKPNSHRSKLDAEKKLEKKKIQTIAQGKTKKKSKLKETFVQEDVNNIKTYVVMDILVPALKKAISDVVTNGVSMLLYGDTKHTDNKRSNVSYVSYNRMSDRGDRYTSSRRIGYSIDDIILSSKAEAEDVIDAMADLIDTYGVVTIADLYDMVNISGEYTDNKYGWTSVRGFDIIRNRDGYLLKLPKARPID